MSDGCVVRGRWWSGSKPTHDTAILYLHGIQSHGGWYEWSASRLASAGLPVLMPDRRGSGLNERDRGDTPSMERWLGDLDELAEWLYATCGATRIAVVGVSWGGKLAAAWALRRPQTVFASLLIAPGLFPQVGVGFLEKARIAAGLLIGGGSRHAVPLDDPALFTANPAAQRFIELDPAKLTAATARFLYQSTRLDRLLVRMPAKSISARVNLLLAEYDRVIRNDSTRRWLSRVCCAPPRVSVLLGAAHTLEFEVDAGPLERELVAWLTFIGSPPAQ